MQLVSWFKKSDNIDTTLGVIIILQPILDILTNWSINQTLSFGIVFRGLFLILLIILALFNQENKRNIKYLLLYGAYCAFFLIIQYVNTGMFMKQEVVELFKLSYLPILLISFSILKIIIAPKWILLSYFIYTSIIIITYIFGIGGSSYLAIDNKTGFISLFNSPNQVSAILIGLMPIIIDGLLNLKQVLLKFGGFISIIITVLLIGTKVLLFGFLIVCSYYLIQFILNKVKNKKKLIMYSLLFFIVLCFTLPFIPAIKNIGVALDFYNIDSFADLMTIENIDKVFLGRRIQFMNDTFEVYKNQNILLQLFGIGFSSLPIKTIEMDIFDIFFRVGLFGLMVFVFVNYSILRKQHYRRIQLFSIFLFILISFFSGHVLNAPSVSIYLACIPFIKE